MGNKHACARQHTHSRRCIVYLIAGERDGGNLRPHLYLKSVASLLDIRIALHYPPKLPVV